MPTKNPARPAASDTVAAALTAAPVPLTAAELAEAAGVGQSTATKALAGLEADGRARRTPGGRGGNGRRQPDRWSPIPTTSTATAEPPAPEPTAPAEQTDTAVSEQRRSDTYMGAKLHRGELNGLVLEYLAGRKGEALGPAEVAKRLGRSAGAVSNSLGRLAQTGEVTLVGDSPRRYRLARR